MQTACKGVLYGCGRQLIGAVLLFISFYVIGLPLGIPLMFLTSRKASGIQRTDMYVWLNTQPRIAYISFAAYWISLDVNLFVQAVVLFGVVAAMNWKKETEKVS